MRVRVNFTIDLDPEQYREVFETELDKGQIREEIQERAISDCVLGLGDEGIQVRLLGRNNVYDPKTRTTRSEQLAGKP